MTPEEIRGTLARLNPEAKIWEEFHDAIIGIVSRPMQKPVLVYSMEKLVLSLIEKENCNRAEAAQAIDTYFLKTDFGKGAPVILIETFSIDYTIGLAKVKQIEEKMNERGGSKAKKELVVPKEKKTEAEEE